MPTANDFSAWLQRALQGTPARPAVLSGDEADELRRRATSGALLPDDVAALIRRLHQLGVAGALALDPARRDRIDTTLADLDRRGLVPPAQPRPAEGRWCELLWPVRRADGGGAAGGELPPVLPDVGGGARPAPPPEEPPRPTPPPPNPAPPAPTPADPPPAGGQPSTAALRAAARRSLRGEAVDVAALVRALASDALDLPQLGAGRLELAAAVALVARAVASSPVVAKVDGIGDELALRAATEPRPLLAALRASAAAHFGGAPPTALPGGAAGAALVARAEALLSVAPAAEGVALDDETADLLLGALAFASGEAGAVNLLASVPVLARLGPGPGGAPAGGLADDVARSLRATLARVVDGSPSATLSFNRWPDEAQRAAGDVTHARAIAPLLAPGGPLNGPSPSFAGLRLDLAQRDALLTRLEVVRDAAALQRLVDAAREVAGAVPFPGETMPWTAWGALNRALQPLVDAAEGAVDRRADLVPLRARIAEEAARLRAQLGPLHDALSQLRTPALGDAPAMRIDAATAAWIARLARERLASDRSLPNLLRALHTGASPSANPPALEGEPAARMRQLVDDYIARWPGVHTFDFNKLDRIVRAAWRGDTEPLFRIGGAEVDPGQFHVQVGAAVKRALRDVPFPLPWIAHRFGYRGRQAAELIDLLAERAAEGRGPVAALRARFPAAELRVLATTSDMEYNALIFQVVHPGGATETWYADSEGEVEPHARAPEPKHVLFTAVVDARGGLDVRVPDRLPVSPRAYPLVNTWGKGDRIDVEALDAAATDRTVETQTFETRYRVRRGVITGYTTQGVHTIAVETPAGTESRTASFDDIRNWNNPHVVSETQGVACSATFNRDRDARFAASLARADTIAREHGLPEFDLGMNEVELAATQKRFLRALNAWTRTVLLYPRHPPFDANDRVYDEQLDVGVHPMGAFLEVARGVCRHQFIHEHMCKQRAGIDERFASGAANTSGGAFRGLHIWGEVMLPDRSRLSTDQLEPSDTRFLSDATWGDAYVPLWEGAYGNDLRRVEMYARTRQYAGLMVKSDLR